MFTISFGFMTMVKLSLGKSLASIFKNQHYLAIERNRYQVERASA